MDAIPDFSLLTKATPKDGPCCTLLRHKEIRPSFRAGALAAKQVGGRVVPLVNRIRRGPMAAYWPLVQAGKGHHEGWPVGKILR